MLHYCFDCPADYLFSGKRPAIAVEWSCLGGKGGLTCDMAE
jgi:hypothetical protein